MPQVDMLPPIKGEQVREWLKFPDKPAVDNRLPIKWTSRSPSQGQMVIANLTELEIEAIEAFLSGTSYIRCVNGRLHAYNAMEPLPTPEEDPLIGPHWRTDGTPKQWGQIPDSGGWHSPGLIMTGLGAGLRRDQDPKRNQQLVEECGFICMRSRRGHDGGYWEQWVLPYMSAAKGPLKDGIAKYKALYNVSQKHEPPWHAIAEHACRFLTETLRVSYGSLDITIQRWALTNGD